MNSKIFLYFLLLLIFAGCNMPSEIKIPDSDKSADLFSKQFIANITEGKPNDAVRMLNPEAVTDSAKYFIATLSSNMRGAVVKNIRVVEYNFTKGVMLKKGAFSYVKIAYEYEFDKGNILFLTTLKERGDQYEMYSFNSQFLPAPLEKITEFTLAKQTTIHYFFLVMIVFVPLFVLISFIILLFTKTTVKKKIIWSLLILFISMSRFSLNWGTGEVDMQLLNFSLWGGGFGRSNLYTYWVLYFNVPIGAILFWFRRKQIRKVKFEDEEMIEDIETPIDSTYSSSTPAAASPAL